MKRKAFISHSSHDHNIAQKICAIFEKNGIACWMAPRDIRPGKDWDAEILRGLNESSVLLLLLSRYSNQSPEVKRELGLANRKNHEIYPIRLENIEPSENLEYFLTFNQWTDVWEGQMEGRLTKIMQAVKAAWGSNGEDGSEEIPGTFTPRLLETLDFAPADYVAAGGLSRDKKKLVLASRKEIKIFDFETLRELATLHGHAEQITSLRFKGSDANTVVSADRQKIITWDLQEEDIENVVELKGGDSYTQVFDLNRSCSQVVSYGSKRKYTGHVIESWLNVIEVESGQTIREIGRSEGAIASAAFIPNTSYVAIGYEKGAIKICDTETGEFPKTRYILESGAVKKIKASPAAPVMLSWAYDSVHFKVWSTESWKMQQTLEHEHGSPNGFGYITDFFFSHDGTDMISLGKGKLSKWKTA